MRSDFSFKSLVAWKETDDVVSLFRKERLELYIAFLYKIFDIQDRKEIRHEDFLAYLRKFLKDESLNMQANGIEELSVENAYTSMMKCNLITSIIHYSKEDLPKYDVVTNVYKDIIRFIEERTGNAVIGGVRHIEESINIMMDNAGLISGDKEHRLKYLEEEKKKLEKEINEIKKTGKVRALTKEEIRANIHNIDRNISNFGVILFRGAMRCKEERDASWEEIRKRINQKERVTNGEVAVRQFDAMLQLNNDVTATALQDATQLLSNRRYKEKMNYIVDTMYANKEAVRIMREDGIDLRARRKQIMRYLRDCSEQISLGVMTLGSFFRSREIKQNRLLYGKADELLLACKEYGIKHSMRNKKFSYRYPKLSIKTPKRRVYQELKQKVKIVNKVRETVIPEREIQVFRDLAMADIPNKFRRLLDRHNGIFTLKEYVDEEHTYFGMFEFIAVKNIMTRYMGEKMFREYSEKGEVYFNVTDYVSGNASYKESEVMALDYEFTEEAYNLWKKDNFRI